MTPCPSSAGRSAAELSRDELYKYIENALNEMKSGPPIYSEAVRIRYLRAKYAQEVRQRARSM